LVLAGRALCLIFVLMAVQARAAQPRHFLTASHGATAPVGARQLCRTYAWACSVSAHASRVSTGDLAAIKSVNRAVNRSVRFVTDQRQFRTEEHWSLPTDRGGDCEDIVLLKKQALIQRGFPAQALLIATALDRQRRGHAVLIVRTDAGDLVLDNLTDRVKKWSDTGYIFLRMQNPDAPSRWVNVVSAN
jgi:predicted transglutaminase-like cysteine proteinase